MTWSLLRPSAVLSLLHGGDSFIDAEWLRNCVTYEDDLSHSDPHIMVRAYTRSYVNYLLCFFYQCYFLNEIFCGDHCFDIQFCI